MRAPSKTMIAELVHGLKHRELAAALAAKPELLQVKDDRGRNWLHNCCKINVKTRGLAPGDQVKTAAVLLDLGLDINEPAFTEGTWKATPLWHAVSFGQSLSLAKFLLSKGSDREHCLWAAAWNNDPDMIRLLVAKGASLKAWTEGHSPLLAATQWGRFDAAKAFLELGADPNIKDKKGRSPLHHLIRREADPSWFKIYIRHGARGDIPGPEGRTAIQILSRKRSPAYRDLVNLF